MDMNEIRMSAFQIVAGRLNNEWATIDDLLAQTQKIVGYVVDPDITEDEKDVVLENRKAREERNIGRAMRDLVSRSAPLPKRRWNPDIEPPADEPGAVGETAVVHPPNLEKPSERYEEPAESDILPQHFRPLVPEKEIPF
jgi:hypothetical protein